MFYPSASLSATPLDIKSSPTEAKPGSEEKILVMMERYSNGQELFHPEDFGQNSIPVGLKCVSTCRVESRGLSLMGVL